MRTRRSAVLLVTILSLLTALSLLVACGEEKKAVESPPYVPPERRMQKLVSEEPEKAPETRASGRRQPPTWLSRVPDKTPLPDLPALEGEKGPAGVYVALRRLAETGDRKAIAKHLTPNGKHLLKAMTPAQMTKVFGGTPGDLELNGGRARLRITGTPGVQYAVFVAEDRRWKYDITMSLKYREWELAPNHPENHPVSLEEATEGIEGEGALYVEMVTTEGGLLCQLYEGLAPITVANFVGLARGKRAFRDPVTKKWVRRPYYDGTIFHKAIPDFMIQAGSLDEKGKTGPGYTIPDELDLRLRHRDGGTLSMANSGPNTAGAQFFVAERSLPWLDDRHAVFGRCWPTDVVAKIARRDKRPGSDRPIVDVVIKELRFRRGYSEE